MKEVLTSQQTKVLEFLKTWINQKSYPPSIREICDGVNLTSTSTVHSHLTSLERKGYIERSQSKNRTIKILDKSFYEGKVEIVELPIVGRVAAGQPIHAIENIDTIFPVSAEYVSSGSSFMLRVKGDSMRDASILDKDLIIVREQPDANNGDIVVAIIGESATVKYFYREKNYIRLESANPEYQPIIEKNVTIVGKVTGLFRKM